MTELTADEYKILTRFRLAATPPAKETNNRLWQSLQSRGLLSIRAVNGDKTLARVVTTDAGMELVRKVDERKFSGGHRGAAGWPLE